MYANLHTIIFTFSRKIFPLQIYYLLSLLLLSRFFLQKTCKQTANRLQKKGKTKNSLSLLSEH